MHNKKIKEIVKREIKNILLEQDVDFGAEYGFTPDAWDMAGPDTFGSSHGRRAFSIFLQPFTDILKTAVYGAKKLGKNLTGVLKGLLAYVGSTLYPFFNYDYQELHKSIRQEIKELDGKYKELLQNNYKAVFGNNDALALAFIFNPSLFLSNYAFSLGMKTTAEIAQSLLRHNRSAFELFGKTMSSISGHGNYYYSYGEMYEQTQQVQNEPPLTKILNNPTIQKAINSNPVILETQKRIVDLFVDKMKKAMKIQNFNQLKSLFPNYASNIEKYINSKEELRNFFNDKQKKESFEKGIVDNFKKQYINFYITKLNELNKQYKNPVFDNIVQQAIKQIKIM